jgi:hypothetical protein
MAGKPGVQGPVKDYGPVAVGTIEFLSVSKFRLPNRQGQFLVGLHNCREKLGTYHRIRYQTWWSWRMSFLDGGLDQITMTVTVTATVPSPAYSIYHGSRAS